MGTRDRHIGPWYKKDIGRLFDFHPCIPWNDLGFRCSFINSVWDEPLWSSFSHVSSSCVKKQVVSSLCDLHLLVISNLAIRNVRYLLPISVFDVFVVTTVEDIIFIPPCVAYCLRSSYHHFESIWRLNSEAAVSNVGEDPE